MVGSKIFSSFGVDEFKVEFLNELAGNASQLSALGQHQRHNRSCRTLARKAGPNSKQWESELRSNFPLRSKRTVQEVERQSTKDEKGKKSYDSSKPTRKKTLARKRAGRNDSQESVKKQKLEDDTEKKELKAYLDIVSEDEFVMEVDSLETKYPIIDWKTHVLTELFMYYQIIRADRSSKNYKIFTEMLDDFKRQDVMDLHRLVEERYTTTSPEGYDLMLWGDLKILFEPDKENELWKIQHEYNLISWRLCDSSGIYILLMDNGIAIHMLIEKKYPLGTTVEKAVYDELSKRCTRIKNICISIEFKVKQYKESFHNNQPCNNQDTSKILAFFEINELKAQLEAKNNSIKKLKDHIATLKGKSVSEGDKSKNRSKVKAIWMYKLDLEPLSPKLLKNREARVDYLKYTQEHADTLFEIVEHARALRPLDSDLDYACLSNHPRVPGLGQLQAHDQPEFERYGPKSCKIESKNASENIPNKLKESTEVKESFDVPLVKKLVLDDKLEKKIVVLDAAKIEFVKAKQ
uniref:Uncharacterized protein n=1 Tax=Tanacetum cinerariifolium TaxID=118510 RepID=A0A6L2MCR1_TANCI|nr:hypothetical protein [Tanacetum cinerariifolium]